MHSRVSCRIFSWEGETFNGGGSGGPLPENFLRNEVQFGFFVCFKPYILLVYSFIDEIVDIFKEKSHKHFIITSLNFRFLGGGNFGWGWEIPGRPPLYETLHSIQVYIPIWCKMFAVFEG